MVVGASVGGLHALRMIFSGIPAGFGSAILVAHHRAPEATDRYRGLLQSVTPLHIAEAVHGDRAIAGFAYIAPAGRHIELDGDGKIYTNRTERLATVRPSVDLLFETVAACYGPRAVSVILSGTGRDGAEGVRALRERGSFVIAQDKNSSDEFGMPCSAIETGRVDLVLPLRHISFALNTLFQN